MARASKTLEQRRLAGQAQPVRMRVAAALAYNHLTGKTRQTATEPEYLVALNSTAMALSQVVDIYYVNDQRKLLRIPGEELALGRFEKAGDIYRTRSGNVYSSIWVRRVDVMDAIAILKVARESIYGAKAKAEKLTQEDSDPADPGRRR